METCGPRCAAARHAGRSWTACAVTLPSRHTMPKRSKPSDSAADLVPDHPTITTVREAAKGCQACDLYKRGTQTVFGEGARQAGLMLVGEQPGDAEDLAGKPFVGPAG